MGNKPSQATKGASEEDDEVQKALEAVATLRLDPRLLEIDTKSSAAEGGFGFVRRAVLHQHDGDIPDGADCEIRRKDGVQWIVITEKRKWPSKVHWIPTGQTTDVAVKYLKFSSEISFKKMRRRYAREVCVWARLKHPGVSPLLGIHVDYSRKELLFVSPWEKSGNVLDYIKKNDPSSDVRLAFIMDIATAVVYLHELNPPIIHGDLKATNVLLTHDLHIRICDFGLATGLEEDTESALATTSVFQGSIPWCAPELFDLNQKRSIASDVYMWGMTAYEILTGKTPYFDTTDTTVLLRRILQGEDPTVNGDGGIPLQMLDVLRRCWKTEPGARPSMKEVQEYLDTFETSDWTFSSQSAASNTSYSDGSTLVNSSPAGEMVGGRNGGHPWSDFSFLEDKPQAEICAIHIYYHSGIHELRVQYRTSEGVKIWADSHGSSAGPWDMKKYLFELATGEHIIEVSGRSGGMIDAIQFTTNEGRTSKWCGRHRGGSPFKLDGHGARLLYFSGRAGDQLDAILPHWTK